MQDALAILAFGQPVTLLSARGAALYAGSAWWRGLMESACRRHPEVSVIDVLDCADAAGLALGALRIGQRHIVLQPSAPGWAAVVAVATSLGAEVRSTRPPALDMARPDASRLLPGWLRGELSAGDSRRTLG